MSKTILAVALIAVALAAGAEAAPAAPQTVESVIGTVTDIDKKGQSASIKTDAGMVVSVKTDSNSVYLRIPSNEKTLAKAVSIQFANIEVGDRVLGRGTRTGADFLAQRLVVLTRADIDKKRALDLDEWRRRGIGGIVKDLNRETGDVTLELRSGGGGRLMVITTKADFRRYGSGSLTFEDAQPSSFAELRPGDQLRALGDKNADGNFKAEQIISGAFRTFGATITEIDLQRNEIKVTSLDQKKPLVVAFTKESALHRIPPPLAVTIAQKALTAKTASGNSATPSSAPKAAPAANQSIDIQQVIEALPKITLADLKAGDVLAITSAVEKDETRFTAIKLVAGVDLVLKAMAPQPGRPQVVRLSAGLPSVFDFSVVQ